VSPSQRREEKFQERSAWSEGYEATAASPNPYTGRRGEAWAAGKKHRETTK